MIRMNKANPGFDSRPWKVSLFHTVFLNMYMCTWYTILEMYRK